LVFLDYCYVVVVHPTALAMLTSCRFLMVNGKWYEFHPKSSFCSLWGERQTKRKFLYNSPLAPVQYPLNSLNFLMVQNKPKKNVSQHLTLHFSLFTFNF